MINCHKCGYINSDGQINCSNCAINLEWARSNLPPFDQPVKIKRASTSEESDAIEANVNTTLSDILKDNEETLEFTIGVRVIEPGKFQKLGDILIIVLTFVLLLLGEDDSGGGISNPEIETWLVVLTSRRVILAKIKMSYMTTSKIQEVLHIETVALRDVKEISIMDSRLIIEITNRKFEFGLNQPWDRCARHMIEIWLNVRYSDMVGHETLLKK